MDNLKDEDGKDIDDVVCSSISALKYYTGDFDIEWGKDITESKAHWHRKEQELFYKWLENNNFDPQDPSLALGYIKIGQCDLNKSFGTTDPQQIWKILSKYLDVYKINIDGVEGTFNYVWTQPKYKELQISMLKDGYNYSSTN